MQTLLFTAILMAVTMFSFETVKQTLFPHVTIWQSHCITIGFSTITSVIVAYILLSLNQIRDMRLAHEISQRRQMEIDIRVRKQMGSELEKARDAALDSARIKSEFLANMSHEIRTPMNGVIGMVGLLLDTTLSEQQRDFAETIRFSANALLKIINDILDFSKMEAGMLKFEKIDFDLRVAVEEAVGLLAENAMSKQLELASLVSVEVPTAVRGDPTRLTQVLTNLIGNAIKITESGEVVVRALMTEESATHVCIRFSVTDTGIGIEQEAQGRLFQAFSQADGSTTRKYGGTGLGLAICRQLVRQMNGEIGLESAPGKGSTFWFTAQIEKQPAGASEAGTARAGSLRGIHALIVDDNATNRKILHHRLTQWGMEKEEAASGVEALEALRRRAREGRPFQLAILDMQMPAMDGWMLAKTIKADPEIAETRLVMMTSLDRQQDAAAMHALGLDTYLTKPVKQAHLFECLSKVMSDPAAPVEQPSKRKPVSDAAVPNGLRVLIAEDNIVNQKVAAGQIRKLGCQPDVVSNGLEVLKALEAADYDLVLMDCQMPEMDGYEATALLRIKEGQARHTIVVAMTAHAIEGDREKCLAAGMDDYLSKPVQFEELREVIMGLPPALAAKGPPIRTSIWRHCENWGAKAMGTSLPTSLILSWITLLNCWQEADEALARVEPLAVAQAAHTLKGSSSNFGAQPLMELAAQLETTTSSPDYQDSPHSESQARQTLNAIRRELERVRGSGGLPKRGMKVLIAEDDPVASKILRLTIEKVGHEVIVVHDGAAAWQRFSCRTNPWEWW